MSFTQSGSDVPFLSKNTQGYDTLCTAILVGDARLAESVVAAVQLPAPSRAAAARALLDATREVLLHLARPALALYSDDNVAYRGMIHLVLPPSALAPSRKLVFYPTLGAPLSLGEVWTSTRPSGGPLDMSAFNAQYKIPVDADDSESRARQAYIDILSKRGLRPGDAFLPVQDRCL